MRARKDNFIPVAGRGQGSRQGFTCSRINVRVEPDGGAVRRKTPVGRERHEPAAVRTGNGPCPPAAWKPAPPPETRPATPPAGAASGRRAHRTCRRFGAGNGVVGTRSRALSMPSAASGSPRSISRVSATLPPRPHGGGARLLLSTRRHRSSFPRCRPILPDVPSDCPDRLAATPAAPTDMFATVYPLVPAPPGRGPGRMNPGARYPFNGIVVNKTVDNGFVTFSIQRICAHARCPDARRLSRSRRRWPAATP